MGDKPSGRIKSSIIWALVNLLWLLPLLYGVKCLVTLNGRCIGPRLDGGRRVHRSLGDLRSVEGEAAVWAGLGYLAIAAFVYAYIYSRSRDDAGGWQLLRLPLCFGSLVALAWCWYKAFHLRT